MFLLFEESGRLTDNLLPPPRHGDDRQRAVKQRMVDGIFVDVQRKWRRSMVVGRPSRKESLSPERRFSFDLITLRMYFQVDSFNVSQIIESKFYVSVHVLEVRAYAATQSENDLITVRTKFLFIL